MNPIPRRAFLAGLGAVVAAPIAAEAQHAGKVYRVGVLSPGSRAPDAARPFLQRLFELGWIAGQNLAFESRYAEGRLDRLPEFAAELVDLKVNVVMAFGTPAALAAKHASATMPIVILVGDPVGSGLVASLARPGGNVTGLTNEAGLEIAAKGLGLLKEAAPKTTRAAVLWNPANPPEMRVLEGVLGAARSLGLTLLPQGVHMPSDLDAAFAALTRARADALTVFPNPENAEQRTVIVGFAATHRLPTMFGERTSVDAGGLMSYGTDPADLLRRAAGYVDKILKGAKPADLPVEQPTKFELVINLKTAKALGLTLPPSLLLRADEVIQ
jgi:putative ABC transport system substrate-binding protein